MNEREFLEDAKPGPVVQMLRRECAAEDHPPHAEKNRIAGCRCGYVRLQRVLDIQVPVAWRTLDAEFREGDDLPRVLDRVKDILFEKMCPEDIADAAAIRRTHRFEEDLGAQSLDVLDGLIALEEAFGREVPDEIAVEWRTVGDVSDYFTTVQGGE